MASEMAKSAAEAGKAWDSALATISGAFDQIVAGVLQGTQTMKQAFARMGEDMAITLAKSGFTELLLGAPAGTFGESVFGTAGKGGGGGIAGLLASSFGGAAATGAINKLFGDAFKNSLAPVTTLFTSAFKAVGSAISGLLSGGAAGGGAAQVAGPAVGGVGAAVGSASQATSMVSTLTKIEQWSAQNYGKLGQMAGSLVQTVISDAEQLVQLTIIAVQAAVKAVPIIGSFLERGGVIPSAMGGMVAGGGTLAILHPHEMVLPRDLSEGVQGAIRGGRLGGGSGTEGGGHTFNNNFHVSAVDGESVAALFHNNQGELVKALRAALRSENLDV